MPGNTGHCLVNVQLSAYRSHGDESRAPGTDNTGNHPAKVNAVMAPLLLSSTSLTMACRSAGSDMLPNVRSQLMPLRVTCPGATGSGCRVEPNPSPTCQKNS